MTDYHDPDVIYDTINEIVRVADLSKQWTTDPYDAAHLALDEHDILELDPDEKIAFLMTLDEELEKDVGEGVDHLYAMEQMGDAETIFEAVDTAFHDALVMALVALHEE